MDKYECSADDGTYVIIDSKTLQIETLRPHSKQHPGGTLKSTPIIIDGQR